MSGNSMTSLERVLKTLGHQEPDRVPFFLLLSLHGAKELGLSIQEYFSKPEYVVEGQLRLRSKYRHDCLYSFFYAAIEMEAWGCEAIFREDGPPNAGEPFLHMAADIDHLTAPRVEEAACLVKVLRTLELLKSRVGDQAPIIGVVMSPFSLPVMQMGFDKYIELLYEQPERFRQLMRVNEAFCIQWANAQLAAGATAICYFDPLSSPTIIPAEMYPNMGCEVARRTISQINGPVATHFATGRCLPIADALTSTGTVAIGVSPLEDLAELKRTFGGKLSLLGNLNGIEMRHWTSAQVESKVKQAITQAGQGGGFILSDSHGEIPWQVPDDVLLAVSEAVMKWGHYPLKGLAERD